jgi:hypothetical protein
MQELNLHINRLNYADVPRKITTIYIFYAGQKTAPTQKKKTL